MLLEGLGSAWAFGVMTRRGNPDAVCRLSNNGTIVHLRQLGAQAAPLSAGQASLQAARRCHAACRLFDSIVILQLAQAGGLGRGCQQGNGLTGGQNVSQLQQSSH